MQNDKALESSKTTEMAALVRCKPVERKQLLLRARRISRKMSH